MNAPENLKYTHDHEWARLDEDGLVVIGITDHAQSELGDIVFVEIDAEGETLEKEAMFGTIEAVKTVSELFMPISGEITEVNEALADAPEKINEDAYGEGWIIKIKPTDVAELESLLDSAGYIAEVGA